VPKGADRGVSRLLLVVCGPIASGKTTVSQAAARLLAERGIESGVVDVDVVYEMLDERGCSAGVPRVWERARRVAAAIAAALFADGVPVVVVEGDFSSEPRRGAISTASGADAVRFVSLRVSLETALLRVRVDPERLLSREPGFLRAHYAGVEPPPLGDLVLDTESVTPAAAAAALLSVVLDPGGGPAAADLP
jgi:adenylylsulfate kinase-like enzyme